MKKSLIALAVLASSGAAMAQSSVTLYGLADVWLGSTKAEASVGGNTASARETVLNGQGFNTSRIGFKGTEDLGGGLKANFTIETAISIDSPTPTSLGSRVASVGLSGGFGSLEAGKTWTPYDDTRAMANDTFNANIASSFSTWLAYEDNPNNMIRYNTPSFGGFTASVAYAFGEDKNTVGATGASSISSLSLNYANGPVVVGVAYQSEDDKGALPDSTGLRSVPSNGKATYTLVNGSYDFGIAKLIAGYNQVKVTETGVAGSGKANEYNIGVDAPLGANLSIGLGYAQSKFKVSGVSVYKATGYSAALKYALSKRTFAYTALTQTKFKDAASTDYVKSNLVAVGVQHSF
jgi:predicted porin